MRFLIGVLCVWTAVAAGRDWKKFPAVVQVDTRAEIWAIGDAHGDFVRLTDLMKGAGLIGADLKWTGGNALLVVTGDMIDKGPRGVEVVRFLRGLRAQGHAIVTAGNHEAEFLADPHAPKGGEFASQLEQAGIKPDEVGQCRSDIGEFLCSLPFAARVNEWYFSHAGNTGGRSLKRMEDDIERGFATDGYKTKQLVGDDSLIEARLNGKGRGVWIDEGRGERELLEAYTAAAGVKHIVEGHVPSEVKFADGVVRRKGEMFQRFGLLFLIDTGMSEGVDDSLGAALHITSKRATAICADGIQTVVWDAEKLKDAGRARPCGK